MSERKIILENMFSLMGVQFINYAFPLITFPYLVRVLGIDGFGLYTFVFSFNQYFTTLTDYGFNLTATRDVSIARDNKQRLSEIFSSVMAVKTLFFIISIFIMVLVVFAVPKFTNDWKLYTVSLISVLGNLIFPVWYYQGIELTKYIAIFNVIAKIITTACIFIFVNTKNDLFLLVVIQSMGVIIAATISLLVIIKYRPIKLIIPEKNDLIKTIIDGKDVFLTILSSTLVNNTNIFLLGIMTNNQTVGYFAVADKIVKVFIALCAPISTAIFPRVSKLFCESRENAIKFLRKVLFWGGITFFAIFLTLILFPDIFIQMITGSHSAHINKLIMIMAILPLSIYIDNIYGTQILINIGRTKDFLMSVLIPGLISLVLSFIFVPMYKDSGTAFIYLISEIMILLLMIRFVRKQGIYLLRLGWL
ncbi:flippase [candidate division TA06 bacterium]|nr:flippase [candidate division TA06 bacterium]